jgi:hypothetical protein
MEAKFEKISQMREGSEGFDVGRFSQRGYVHEMEKR